MADFRKMISPKSRAEFHAGRDQLAAFQDMDPAGMAQALLEAQSTLLKSGALKAEPDWSWEEWAIHGCVPALANRLDPDLGTPAREDLVSTGTDEDLLNAIQLTIPHARFVELRASSPEANTAVDFLFGNRSHGGALAVAMDTVLPGCFPERVDLDTRAPLAGVQLIGSFGDHDRVLRYADSEKALDDLYRAAVAKREREDLSHEDEILLRQLRSWPERLDFDALSIQTFDGTVLREQSFLPEEDATPSM